MVKLCYLLPLIILSAHSGNAISTELSKPMTRKQKVLGKDHGEYIRKHYAPMKLQLEKRVSYNPKQSILPQNQSLRSKDSELEGAAYSYSIIGGFGNEDNDISENEIKLEKDAFVYSDSSNTLNPMPESSRDNNKKLEMETYRLQKLQSDLMKNDGSIGTQNGIDVGLDVDKNGYKFKEYKDYNDDNSNIANTDGNAGYDGSFHSCSTQSAQSRINTEALTETLEYYLTLGKEKWAGFLATSNCSKFLELFKRLQNKINSASQLDKIEETYSTKELTCANCRDGSKADVNRVYSNFDTPKAYDRENRSSSQKHEVLFEVEDQNCTTGTLFDNIAGEKKDQFMSLLQNVVSYWERENAKDILQASRGVAYKDFKLGGDVYNETANVVKQNKIAKTQSEKYNHSSKQREDYYDTPDENDSAATLSRLDEYHSKNPRHRDLLESIHPTDVKTKEQEAWLRANAIRRAQLLQELVNGNHDEKMLQQDLTKYRDENIFLDQDENEFVSNGVKLKPRCSVSYGIFFAVTMLYCLY